MNPYTEKLAQSLMRELFSRRGTWLILALLISAASLTVGFVLPKHYTAYASILTENKSIVGPLMEGVAEQTDVADLAGIVRELAISRRLLEQFLEVGGWSEEALTPAARELEMNKIVARTSINNQGRNLIGIEYTDVDPERAHLITRMYIDWVIQESRESKRRESLQAFQFIEKQAGEYHQKLLTAEEGLKQFRSENMDALPESAQEVSERATQLRRDHEALQLELSELAAREKILMEQLSGEAEITTALGQDAQYRTRLVELQRELGALRLSYHDTYPDIIRVMGQIEELQQALSGESSVASNIAVGGTGSENENQQNLNPLYSELRSQLSTARTDQKTVEARMKELSQLLQQEVSRIERIAEAEAALAELTRDYEVNRSVYQDLLRRRENARVSMNLDAEDQGLIMKVQEPPVVPQAPSGLRFIHIVAAGLAMCLAVPLGISAAFVQFDPRLRVKEQIELLDVPVLAVIGEMKDHSKRKVLRPMLFAGGFTLLMAMYGLAAWVKMTEGALP